MIQWVTHSASGDEKGIQCAKKLHKLSQQICFGEENQNVKWLYQVHL